MSEPDAVLDARGLLCPLPMIRLQALARGRAEGTVIQVTATDPGVRQDIPAWCRVHGHRVLAIESAPRETVVWVELGPPPQKRAR